MKSSFRLGRIAGIEIGIHYTWILAFVLFSWLLAQSIFPQINPGFTVTTYWILGIAGTLLLFISVLLHELAHSLVAQSRGLPVSNITLFIFGGVSNLSEEPEKPRIEFFMAIVGPLTSLALAGVFWGVVQLLGTDRGPITALLSYLSLTNLYLALFNLLPGFPLDGGRVLRSILWSTTHNLNKATNIAAIVGRLFGWGFIAYGVYITFIYGNFVSGLWIAFIGWFLSNAADTARQEVTLREHLGGAKVKDVMYPKPEAISPKTMVAEVVRDIFRQRYRRAVPVCDDGRPVGVVTITDVRELPQEKWAYTPVEQIMTRQPLYSVTPEDDLNSAMKLLAQHDLNQVLVINEGQCVGLLSRADIISYLQLSQELKMNRPKPQ